MINFSWFTFKIIYVGDYLQGKVEKSMNMNMAERHQIHKEKKKIHLETCLLFLWENILLVLHIELDKVQHVLSYSYFPGDSDDCFCDGYFEWRHTL